MTLHGVNAGASARYPIHFFDSNLSVTWHWPLLPQYHKRFDVCPTLDLSVMALDNMTEVYRREEGPKRFI